MEIASEERINLGQTELFISPMGTGAWSWGDWLFWGFGREYRDEDIAEAFTASLREGINFFDTAESYGRGRSEIFLGQFVKETTQPVVVATKFMPYPWRLWKGQLIKALKASLKRLDMPCVDLYQVHWPFPPIPVETWAEGLADALEAGLARAVGVSNYNEEQMRRAYSTLAARGVRLTSNQVEFHLLKRKVELNGLLKACQELGVTLIAYSPLAQGILTGKYAPENPPPGMRGRRYSRAYLERIQPLLHLMQEIGERHEGKSPTQVAINWCICKGTVPIPGAKTSQQASENAGSFGWRLEADEMEALDKTSLAFQN
jgi:aryl-alcohol dehydrogenase-like predicted oxidoreductase